MRLTSQAFLSALPILMGAAGLNLRLMGCGSDDPAPPPPPPPTTTTTTLSNSPGSLPSKQITVTGEFEVGTELEIDGIPVKIGSKAKGAVTISVTTIGNSFIPLQQAQGTTSTQTQVQVSPRPVPAGQMVWTSGGVSIGQMSDQDIASINAGGEPIHVMFAFPFASADEMGNAGIASLGIRVFDTNGTELSSLYSGTRLEAQSSTWPEWAPFPDNMTHATINATWVNQDGSNVTPQQLGLDSAPRVFKVYLRSSDVNASYNFCYGLALWRYRKTNQQHVGDGSWLGWHSDNWTNANQGCAVPVISAIQDVQGNYVSSVGAGDVIQVVVDHGYDLPWAAFQVADKTVASISSAVVGPGPSERTYTFTVPSGVSAGAGYVYFKNHGATPKFDPSNIGAKCPGSACASVTVR